MKANELMIGDWVNIYVFPNESPKDKDLFPAIITTIMTPLPNEQGGEHIECIFKSEDGGIGCATRPVNTCLPIPITPEILEKNGFKIDKNETYCKRYFFASNLGKVPQTVVEFSFYGEGVSADTLFKCWTKPESCDGENSIHICDLKSVHELQHCLKLVGIDKEITI